MSRLIISILLLCGFSISVVKAFSIEPGMVELSLAPDQSGSQILNIENGGPNPITLNISPVNLKFSSDGSLRFITSTQPPATWVKLSQNIVRVPEYSKSQVSWSLSIPRDTPLASAYGAILVYQQTDDNSSQVSVSKQLASLFFVDITNNSRKGMSILNFSHKTNKFYVTIANSGNTYIRPHGKIEIVNQSPIIVNQDYTYILPDDKKTFELLFNKWGWYEAKLTLDAEGATPVYEIITFANIPWKGIMGICLFLGCLFTILLRAQRSRR